MPRQFVLYGGTGLALRLGHRASVDFDFFSTDPLDHRALSRLGFVSGAQVLQEEVDALTVSVSREGPVTVSFFGPIGKVLLQRVEAKDYLDLAALIHAGVPLSAMLSAARTLFGDAFNPLIARKTLGYFKGGDLATLDSPMRELLTRASLEDFELSVMPLASARLD